MANGGGKSPAELAASLSAQQGRDLRREISPLELPQRSYTSPTEPEVEGLPSAMMEMQEQRQREARMRETAEQFVGAPVTPSAEEAPTEEAPAPRRRRPGAPAETAAPGEEAVEVRAQQEQERRRITQAAERRDEAARAAQGEYIAGRRKQLKETYDAVKGVSGITSVTGIGFVALVLMLNAQLINQFTIQNYDLIPEPELLDYAEAGCLDTSVCCAILPTLLPGCAILLLIALVIGSLGR